MWNIRFWDIASIVWLLILGALQYWLRDDFTLLLLLISSVFLFFWLNYREIKIEEKKASQAEIKPASPADTKQDSHPKAKKTDVIDTPLSIVYVGEFGKLEILPYLDISRKDEVWGIECCGRLWCKTLEEPCFWEDACSQKQFVGGRVFSLPRRNTYLEMFSKRAEFAEVILLFQKHHLAADYWVAGWYWCEAPESEREAPVFGMGCGTFFLRDKKRIPSIVRLSTPV